MQHITVGNIHIDVEKKNIKNIHLSVHPPCGTVKISAPKRVTLDTIRVFAISKLQWITKQQLRFNTQERETPREYISRESHYFQGKRYLLNVIEHNNPPKIVLQHNEITLYIRPATSVEKRKIIIKEWYRMQLKILVPPLITKWEKKIGIHAKEFRIKKMRTRWGTCNIHAKRIWLNLELAKKPMILLEYIIVHELVHFLERRHNKRFVGFMDTFMPTWRSHQDTLNRLPVGHVNWPKHQHSD